MKKKTPAYLTLDIRVDALREHAVDHVFESLEGCHPEVMPSKEEVIARFDNYIRDHDDLVHAMETDILNSLDHYQFFDEYEEEYIHEILEKNEVYSQVKQDKLRSSGLAKLTPEERAALGLKS